MKSALDAPNSAFGSLTEFGMKTNGLAQTMFAAVTSSVADPDAESSKAKSKTSKTNSKPGRTSSQANKGAKRKAA